LGGLSPGFRHFSKLAANARHQRGMGEMALAAFFIRNLEKNCDGKFNGKRIIHKPPKWRSF
jgi:hypothetical protein